MCHFKGVHVVVAQSSMFKFRFNPNSFMKIKIRKDKQIHTAMQQQIKHFINLLNVLIKCAM